MRSSLIREIRSRRHDRARRARGRPQGQDRPVRHAAERQSRGNRRDRRLHQGHGRRRDRTRLLDAAVLAHEGAELVHIYIDLMNAGASYQAIRDAIHIHPTLAEALQSAVSAVD